MKVLLSLPLIVATLLVSACGSDHTPPISKGEQLTDLQDAYKSRAITPDEYEDQKEEILDQ